MGKLSQIVFNPRQQKEFEIHGHKVVLRSLTTKDQLNMDFSFEDINPDKPTMKETVKATVELLAHALVSVDGEKPESLDEARIFFVNQDRKTVFDFADKYHEIAGNKDMAETVKN